MVAMIELLRVAKTYPGAAGPAIDDVSFSVGKGELVAILGPSGCGKTTLLRLIAGFESPNAGVLSVGGGPVAGEGFWIPPEERSVGMVFQEYALFPHLTVAQNVGFGLSRHGRRDRQRRVREILELVGLETFARRYPHELSGGQQQRVALARAVAPEPVVVLLDEPFSNLDPDLRGRMREEVQEILLKTKMSAILVTHDHEEAFAFAHRIGVLMEGKLVQIDTPEEIYHHPATRFVAEFVGQADFLSGRVRPEGIETELGLFPPPRPLPPGVAVEVLVRPDDIQIKPNPGGMGVINTRVFRGSENLYAVALPSGLIVHCTQSSTTVLEVGSRVEVWADVLHTVVFET